MPLYKSVLRIAVELTLITYHSCVVAAMSFRRLYATMLKHQQSELLSFKRCDRSSKVARHNAQTSAV